MRSFTKACTRIIERYLPDAYLFAIILTAITFVCCLLFTDAGPMGTLMAWGDGIWNLLAFTCQMATVMVFGYAFSKTRAIEKLLASICKRIHTPVSAYFVTSMVAAIFSWICWPTGLICGAFIAIELGRRVRGTHFLLLVASAYSGFLVFQMGFTGTPLILNTPGTWSEAMVGLVPVSETIFSPMNLTLAMVLELLVVPFLMSRMAPPPEEVVELDREKLPEQGAPEPKKALKGMYFNDWVENNYFFNFLLGGGLTVYLIAYFVKGGSLTINSTNLIFMTLGLLLTPTPIRYVKCCIEGAATAGGVIMQFPLYAGIQGMMLTTGLAQVIAGGFVAISTVNTLPLWSFLSAGIVNMFIPSGGSQWSVQGPIMLEAAQQMGTSVSRVALAVCYGDNWTNMIQPFWALPLLAIANLKAKDIMGYLVTILLVSGIIIGCTLVFWPV